jgi:hypothetical protein
MYSNPRSQIPQHGHRKRGAGVTALPPRLRKTVLLRGRSRSTRNLVAFVRSRIARSPPSHSPNPPAHPPDRAHLRVQRRSCRRNRSGTFTSLGEALRSWVEGARGDGSFRASDGHRMGDDAQRRQSEGAVVPGRLRWRHRRALCFGGQEDLLQAECFCGAGGRLWLVFCKFLILRGVSCLGAGFGR